LIEKKIIVSKREKEKKASNSKNKMLIKGDQNVFDYKSETISSFSPWPALSNPSATVMLSDKISSRLSKRNKEKIPNENYTSNFFKTTIVITLSLETQLDKPNKSCTISLNTEDKRRRSIPVVSALNFLRKDLNFNPADLNTNKTFESD
jgi:hypothetical protein